MTGRLTTPFSTNVSASCWSSASLSLMAEGARHNVSAVYRSFPGTCVIVWSNLARRSRNRRIRGGRLSRCLDPRSGTSGLWSVSIANFLPNMYVENLSHAHVVANASILIWAYRVSVSVIDLDAYAIGLHSNLLCCRRTAPSPWEDASALTLVGAWGS